MKVWEVLNVKLSDLYVATHFILIFSTYLNLFMLSHRRKRKKVINVKYLES